MIICYDCKKKLHKNEAFIAWIDNPNKKNWRKVYRCKKCHDELRKMLGCPKKGDAYLEQRS